MKNDTTYLPKRNNIYNGNETLVKKAILTDFELYNIKEDISEAENVVSRYPEVFNKMKLQLITEYNALLEDSHIWNRESKY